jgi:very-short-patch-repair endonuclease
MPATRSTSPEATPSAVGSTDWHQRFARYYEDVLRSYAQTSSRSLTALDKLFKRQVACDLGLLGQPLDACLDLGELVLDVRTEGGQEVGVESDESEEEEEDQQELEFVGDAAGEQEFDRRLTEVRAARKIHRTQTQDPYNRETVIGGPILRLKRGGTTVAGPLLYWDVDIRYDPAVKRITLAKRTEVPELNTMLLEPFLAEGQGMDEVMEAIRPHLLEGLPSGQLVRKVVEVVTGLFDDLDQLSLTAAADLPIRGWLRETGEDINMRGVLINAPKSNAVLLNDLRLLGKAGSAPASAPLQMLTRPEDAERDPTPRELPLSFSDSEGGMEPLYFPFESNPAQRSIAMKAERATILSVQGPPGTGKSHTIANLVCHLVATGRTVLVTSHQPKAVEVVRDLLKTMSGLALSLASGDRKASHALQARIQTLINDSSLRSDRAAEEVKRGTETLEEFDRELRMLAHRFQELRQNEHTNWEGFQTYEQLRHWDRIDPEDSPRSEDADRIVQHLPRWFELRRTLAERYSALVPLLCPEGEETAGTVEARILSNLRQLLEVGRSFQISPPDAAVQRAKGYCEYQSTGGVLTPEFVEALLAWLDRQGWSLVEHAEQAGVRLEGEHVLASWTTAARTVTDDVLQELESRFHALANRFEDRDRFSDGSLRLNSTTQAERLRSCTDALHRASSSLLSWHFTRGAWRARKVAAEMVGEAPDRATLQPWSERVKLALERFDAERDAKDVLEELSGIAPPGVPLPALQVGQGSRAEWLRGVRILRALSTILRLSRDAPAGLYEGLTEAAMGRADGSLSRETIPRISAVLRSVLGLYRREDLLLSIREDTPLIPEWQEKLDPLLVDLLEGRISDRGVGILDSLGNLLEAADAFRQIRDLQRGELGSLPCTLRNLVPTAEAGEAAPEWVDGHIAEALQAHRLGCLIRGSLNADPDDVGSVTEALRKGQNRRRELISKVIERKLRLRQARVLEEGTAASELQRVNRLLGMSGRLRASLVSLRDQIDYRTVLGACPAWLGTIDDACRLFPAKAELFDYIIVDEASQCAQPALLPLALRCRHLVVVGDKEQLRPSFGRFLKQASLDALRVKHGLAEHRAGVFAGGGDSVLEFAEYRANQRGFLDEHFRCDPAIIWWSNERIYNGRLKILTERRPRSFKPALEIRELHDADDDPDRKQNAEEARAVVRELRRLTGDPANDKLTMGVISPFRQQADLIQALLEKEFERDAELIEKHQIVASTADGFQGDERDIILYSFRLGPSSNPNSLGVLEREKERFNVAFSRAKRLAISFISTSLSRFPSSGGSTGLTRDWLEHSQVVQKGVRFGAERLRPDQFDSEFERSVCHRLRDRGLTAVTQEPCGPFRIDLVVSDGEGRILAVECDGSWKMDEFGHLRPEDYQRQDLIERAGWVVHRISGRKYLLNPVEEIDRVEELLKQQPTDRDRAVMMGEVSIGDTAEDVVGHVADNLVELTAVGPHEGSEAQPAPVDIHAYIPDDIESPPAVEQTVLGKAVEEIRPTLRELIRWTLLGARVRTGMFDRLIEIDEKLAAGRLLDGDDIKALEFTWPQALQQGFTPE